MASKRMSENPGRRTGEANDWYGRVPHNDYQRLRDLSLKTAACKAALGIRKYVRKFVNNVVCDASFRKRYGGGVEDALRDSNNISGEQLGPELYVIDALIDDEFLSSQAVEILKSDVPMARKELGVDFRRGELLKLCNGRGETLSGLPIMQFHDGKIIWEEEDPKNQEKEKRLKLKQERLTDMQDPEFFLECVASLLDTGCGVRRPPSIPEMEAIYDKTRRKLIAELRALHIHQVADHL